MKEGIIMKTWTIPAATTQQFAANDYVSTCYNIWCVTPQGNGPFAYLAADSNGNGVYDDGVDQKVFVPEAPATWMSGCGGQHEVRLEGELPTNNGFVIGVNFSKVTTTTAPVYFWYGDVIGQNVEPENNFIENLHLTDLSRSDALADVSNKS